MISSSRTFRRRPRRRTLTTQALAAATATTFLAAAPPPAAAAQGAAAPPPPRGLDASVSLVASTLGYGAEFDKLVTGHLSVRAAGYFLSYHLTHTVEDVDYDGTIKFGNFSALVDYFPFRRGSFHLSGGVVTGSNDIKGVGVPQPGGTFTFNGNAYTTDQVETVHARAVFPSTRPYVGLGWGSPAKHGFHLTSDLGASFGAPKYTLATTGAGAPGLAADVEASRQKTQKDMDRYVKAFPVFRTGLTYAF